MLERALDRARGPDGRARGRELERLALALAAHDPERTLERGYALVEDRAGEPVTSARRGRERRARSALRFHDGDRARREAR